MIGDWIMDVKSTSHIYTHIHLQTWKSPIYEIKEYRNS